MRSINVWLILVTAFAGAFGSAAAYHSGFEKGRLRREREDETTYSRGAMEGAYRERAFAAEQKLDFYRDYDIHIQWLRGCVSDLQERVKKLEQENP